MKNLQALCSSVMVIAREAGHFIKLQRATFSNEKVEYKGTNDLVSYVDKSAEQMLVDRLKVISDQVGFITEENTAGSNNQEWHWIIDPLDGTTNFVHGIPCYCVSVALAHHQEVVMGVIYEINLDECFYAWEGGGAWLNGKPIHVSDVNQLSKALIATGFPYTDYSRMKEYMDVFDYCMHHTHGLRRLGSAAVDMAYVACGRLEAFYEYGLNSWDIAAGCCIVKEAGGMVTDFSGGNNFLNGREIISSNSGCHFEFLKIVKEKFKTTR